MRKILFIAYHFPPEGGVAVQRTLNFVEALPAEGFMPVVVAGPTPFGPTRVPIDPCLLDRVPATVRVHRAQQAAPIPSSYQRVAERWLGLSGVFSEWWVRGAQEIAATIGDDVELVYATMSPFESGEAAFKISDRRGLPWVADLRDPWALDEFTITPTILHRKLEMRKMERLLGTAALIIMNTPEASEAVRNAFPRLRGKAIITITNGFCEKDFSREVAERRDLKFRIVHSGGFSPGLDLWLRRKRIYRALGGAARGVDLLARSPLSFLKAVERWCDLRPEVPQNLEIVFAGQLTERDRAMTKDSAIARLVQCPGHLAHDKSIELVRTADLLFFTMHNLPRGERTRTIQAKTYEYMASGRPIMAAVPEGDARDFLSRCGTALLCWPDDVGGMVEQLDKAYEAWKAGRPIGPSHRTFVEQFAARRQAARLAQAFSRVLAL
jgi:glycosyltransferase involved in cell wall biosynthesis